MSDNDWVMMHKKVPMRLIDLRTAVGNPVAVVEIPDVEDENLPKIIVWNHWCFAKSATFNPLDHPNDQPWFYFEVTAVWV